MGLFGKSKKQKELDIRRNLYTALSMAENAKGNQREKKVLYQCRYCGAKFIRNATEGAPQIAHCPRHPKGWCKGIHSYMRTYL